MSEIKEKWRPVKGEWGTMYHVSNFGRVKALERTVKGWRGPVVKKERLIKPTKHPNGDLCFRAWSEGKNKVFMLKRAVAECFVRNNAKKIKVAVAHKDGDRYNCEARNLYWVSLSEILKGKRK